MRRAKIESDTVITVGGWDEAKTSDNYGEGVSPSNLKKELDKITFEGVDFSHLYVEQENYE